MRYMDRRTFGTSAVLALAGGLAAACSSSSSPAASGTASDLSSVTLNIGDQKGTGAQTLLTASGLIGTLPFKAAWSDFTSGPPMLEAMAAGSVDVGGVGDAPPVFAAAGGEAVTIVGARKDLTGDGDALLIPKGSSVTSIGQLRGKKIAVGNGSSANYHLLSVLTSAGLTPKDVTLVNLQPANALAAFTSGSVDAWDIWAPYVQQAEAAGAKILAGGPSYGSPYSYQVASKAAVSSKAAALRAYLTTLNKAYTWAAANPDKWAVVWGKAAGLSTSIMQQAAAANRFQPVPIGSAIVASEQQLVNQFYAAGLIPTKVDISGFITTKFNETVA